MIFKIAFIALLQLAFFECETELTYVERKMNKNESFYGTTVWNLKTSF